MFKRLGRHWAGVITGTPDTSKTNYGYDTRFYATRSHGPTKSVPDGTNFNRTFARLGPAPDYFRLNLHGWAENDKIEQVRVLWAFSFL